MLHWGGAQQRKVGFRGRTLRKYFLSCEVKDEKEPTWPRIREKQKQRKQPVRKSGDGKRSEQRVQRAAAREPTAVGRAQRGRGFYSKCDLFSYYSL